MLKSGVSSRSLGQLVLILYNSENVYQTIDLISVKIIRLLYLAQKLKYVHIVRLDNIDNVLIFNINN